MPLVGCGKSPATDLSIEVQANVSNLETNVNTSFQIQLSYKCSDPSISSNDVSYQYEGPDSFSNVSFNAQTGLLSGSVTDVSQGTFVFYACILQKNLTSQPISIPFNFIDNTPPSPDYEVIDGNMNLLSLKVGQPVEREYTVTHESSVLPNYQLMAENLPDNIQFETINSATQLK
jgi:hypothetical protein